MREANFKLKAIQFSDLFLCTAPTSKDFFYTKVVRYNIKVKLKVFLCFNWAQCHGCIL